MEITKKQLEKVIRKASHKGELWGRRTCSTWFVPGVEDTESEIKEALKACRISLAAMKRASK